MHKNIRTDISQASFNRKEKKYAKETLNMLYPNLHKSPALKET
jgi:hypothetical protein